MRSEGFSFYTLGVWGLRCVRWTPLLCSRVFAGGCNRTRERKFAVPLGSFTGVVIFRRFTCLQPSFCVAGVALRDMWTCLATCGKPFFVAGAILLQRFQKMRYIFFMAGAALWTCPTQFFVAGAVLQTCRVACFSQVALARLHAVATTCKFRGRRGIS